MIKKYVNKKENWIEYSCCEYLIIVGKSKIQIEIDNIDEEGIFNTVYMTIDTDVLEKLIKEVKTI